jgi:hypothetical protein
MTAEKGGPAFPSKKRIQRAGYATQEFEPVDGMTLRDYFAAKAMQTMISYRRAQFGTVSDEMDWDEYFPIIAQEAYALADAMLEARKS